jgi:hypothetical protein
VIIAAIDFPVLYDVPVGTESRISIASVLKVLNQSSQLDQHARVMGETLPGECFVREFEAPCLFRDARFYGAFDSNASQMICATEFFCD